jgi:hypothetical protein
MCFHHTLSSKELQQKLIESIIDGWMKSNINMMLQQ